MSNTNANLLWWLSAVVGTLLLLKAILRNLNSWIYERMKLREKRYSLPPGDMGWPLIGNMWSFLRAFKSSDPDSFMTYFIQKFGPTGMHKAFMFGNPSIIITSAEACKRVMTDDDNFTLGWPKSTMTLMGRKSFISISYEEHKRLRKLTSSHINGYEALSVFVTYIESIAKSELDKWSRMGQIEFLTECRRLTFKIIMHIFLSNENEKVIEDLEREYTDLNYGVRAMAINIPGFAFHKALKARKRLVDVLQSVVDVRREQRRRRIVNSSSGRKDTMDTLLDVVDEEGRKLSDEEIIDLLIMYLNAGHESSGHTIMWATFLLQQHPEVFQKAKEEAERIVRERDPEQKGLTMKDIRKMKYLSNVVDETLRWVTFSLVVFREAKTDVNVGGYLIPKGWKILVWFRSVHFDPNLYPDPKQFNPSRWDGHLPKPGTFMPFGLGSRLCPGNELALLEITIFLHYFLLGYRLDIKNPGCPSQYLPHRRPKDNCLAKVVKLLT